MDAGLSNSEKEAITKQLKSAIGRLIRGCQTLDMEMAFDVFLNSPDFLMMGTDGTLFSYDQYLQNNLEYLQACDRFKLTTFKEEIRILDRQTATFAWAYAAEATLKTGEKEVVDNAGATFVFQNRAGAWKVVYYHESSLPPRRVLPA